MKQYNEDNKAKISDNKKRYYKENKDSIIKKNLIYAKNNKSVVSERNRLYRVNNIDSYAKRDKLYYQNNREKVIRSVMKYRKVHTEQHRISGHKRNSIRRKLPWTLTLEQWEIAKLHFNNECAYCGNKHALAQDHLIPVAKGGEYTKDNIIPSCQSCNSSKGKKEFTKWYSTQEYYSVKRESKILKYLGYNKQRQQLSIF